MDMRMYDPAVARWTVMDPVIHHSMSPYNAFDNNPVFWADPSGADTKEPVGVVKLPDLVVMGTKKKSLFGIIPIGTRSQRYMRTQMSQYNRLKDKGLYDDWYRMQGGDPNASCNCTADEHESLYADYIWKTNVSPRIAYLNKKEQLYQGIALVSVSPLVIVAGLEVGGVAGINFLSNYISNATLAKGTIDITLQLGIKDDIDFKQTAINSFAAPGTAAFLNTGNNFLNSAIEDKSEVDFGKNILKGIGNGFGYGFGQIGQAAGAQGNQVLGSMFGTEILPGVYTNSTDQVLDIIMTSEE